MTRDVRGERVVAQGVTDGARRGGEAFGHGGVGGVLSAWDLTEESEDALLKGRLVREGDFGEVWRQILR